MDIIEIDTGAICRFCHRSTMKKLHPLSDKTLQTFLEYFSLKIDIIDYLPNQICDDCHLKTLLFIEFRRTVTENERILHETIKKGQIDLKSYFSSILTPDLKVECDKNDSDCSLDGNSDGALNSDQEIHEKNADADDFKSKIEEIVVKNVPDDQTDSKPSGEHVKAQKTTHNSSILIFKFQCLTCFESFESQNHLLSHYKTEHYEKPKENKVTITFSEEKSHDGWNYKCSACNKSYDTKKSMNRHVASGHSDARPFLCKICGRTYKTASEIVRHGRAHNGTKLFCSLQCGYSTVYHGALKEHERRHNTSDFKYKCEKCNKGFHVKTWYLQHQNVHSGLKPFVCDICGDAFHMDKYLTTHRSLKHPQSSNLRRYVCVHCSLRCDSRNALNEHLKKEHGLKTEKSFLCDLCGKVLSSAEQLKLHKRMHVGDKPYTCSTCNKSFAKKFNLQLHERSHSGARAHACRCGRRYAQRSTLLRHINRHHSEDKIKFSECKTFPPHEQHVTEQKLCS